MLSRFRWYRRMRGGYWAQVTAPMSLLAKTKWVRCKEVQPTPDHKWEFYPWGAKTMGNGYIDEWHQVEPCWAVPFSSWVAETIGTNDMACVLALIREARTVSEHAGDGFGWGDKSASERSEIIARLRGALLPFSAARCVEPSNVRTEPSARRT